MASSGKVFRVFGWSNVQATSTVPETPAISKAPGAVVQLKFRDSLAVMDSRFRGNDQSGQHTRICHDATGSCAIREPDGRGTLHGAYAVSMAFSRCSHSSSSTISKRMILPRMAGANSAQSCCFACREQRSNTERL